MSTRNLYLKQKYMLEKNHNFSSDSCHFSNHKLHLGACSSNVVNTASGKVFACQLVTVQRWLLFLVNLF